MPFGMTKNTGQEGNNSDTESYSDTGSYGSKKEGEQEN